MALLPVIPGQLPSGFCATDYQSILNEFSAHQSVDVSAATGSGIVVSATKPVTGDLPWLRLDAFGRPERIYWFASGAWLSLHPSVPGLTQWWFDVLPDFTTFDGGDALALSAISGPMWQQAKNSDGVVIAAKFPVAAGTLPSGTVLAQGATGGEEKHTLTADEIPGGVPTTVAAGSTGSQLSETPGSASIAGILYNSAATGNDSGQLVVTTKAAAGGVVAGNNMPPFVVGYLLQRTTRLFYAIT